MDLRIAGFLSALALSGCAAVEAAVSSIVRPTASLEGVKLDDLSLDGADLVFAVRIDNPYGAPLPLVGMGYALESRGATLVEGDAEATATIPAKGSKQVELPLTLRFASILDALSGVKPGATVPYSATLELGVDAPGVGRIALPISHDGELPVPAAPRIEVTRIQWGRVSASGASATVHLSIDSENDFPIDLDRLSYDLQLAKQPIASATIDSPKRIGADDRATIEIPVTIEPAKLGAAAFRALSGQDVTYGLSGTLELGTPFGKLDMPFARSGRTSPGA